MYIVCKMPSQLLCKLSNNICVRAHINIRRRNFSSSSIVSNSDLKKVRKSTKYKHTILFPSTPFPSNLSGKERLQNERKLSKSPSVIRNMDETEFNEEFILHDGPPYANGKLHMGHSLNKILKDIIVRYKFLKGYRTNFVLGWDCHGLPIELKALEAKKQKIGKNWEEFSPMEIRSKADQLARDTISLQRKVFQRWGLFVNWSDRYCTFDSCYVAKELRLFKKLCTEGYIFQAFMPVHFSPSSRTSLAESELEYNDNHVSPSLYLACPLTDQSRAVYFEHIPCPIYLCIWTTTPWTLPANMAISIREDKMYTLLETLVEASKVVLVCMSERLDELVSVLKSTYKILQVIPGKDLCGLTYSHPYSGMPCPVLSNPNLSSDKGTGLVHTAPAHGKDDFLLALSNGISTEIQLVDERGQYSSKAGSLLEGKDVLKEGNHAVIEIIRSKLVSSPSSLVLHLGSLVHSYPYDWRTKKPTIVRASKQWFFDVNRVKESAIKALDSVQIHPEKLRKNFVKLLESRPYWCLSRQRSWGVPIPVFYDTETDDPVINCDLIEHVASLIEKEGADIWWKYSEDRLLPPEYVDTCLKNGKKLPQKGRDILDVWFDSGSSWFCAIDGKVADLYLEGLDQTNGWFQSSLLLSVAATGKAPYKMLFLHNFIVDESKQKMSKSLGNVFDPEVITDGRKDGRKSPVYGVNVLRWWAVSFCPTKDIPFGPKIIESCEKDVRSLRSSFSFLLGNIKEFPSVTRQPLKWEDLRVQDQYVLSLVKPYLDEIFKCYENFEFEKMGSLICRFIIEDIGNRYMNSVKDILYFEEEKGRRRKSVQTVLMSIIPFLAMSIFPVLPLLTEEVVLAYQEQGGVLRLRDNGGKLVTPPSQWSDFEASEFEQVLNIEKSFHDQLYTMNEDSNPIGTVADSNKYEVRLKVDSTIAGILTKLQPNSASDNEFSDLCCLLRTSKVSFEEKHDISGFDLHITKAMGTSCERCRKITRTHSELCPRCERVLKTVST